MTNHRQKMKELLPIIQAYCDGAEVEYSISGRKWQLEETPTFLTSAFWRIKQTVDSIDWSHVHSDYKWLARDENGICYLYQNKPEHSVCMWHVTEGRYEIAEHFSSYKQGTIDWKYSLIERPAGE